MFNAIIHNIKSYCLKYLKIIQKPSLQKLVLKANIIISRTAKFHPHLHYYSSNIYILLALTHLNQKKHKHALEYCELSIFHDPQYTLAHDIKNIILQNATLTKLQLQKKYKDSITLKRLISEFDHTLIYYNAHNKTEYYKANSLFHKNELNNAIQILRIYIKSNKNNGSALCDLGRMLIHTEQYKEAEKMLKKSLLISSNNFIAYLWLGTCNIFLHKLNKANAYLLEAIALLSKQHEHYHKNFSKHFYKRGLLHHKLDEIDLALNDLNRSLDLHRSNIDALSLRAKILFSITNYTDAMLDIEKIESKYPNNKIAQKIKKNIKANNKNLEHLI